MKKTLISYAQYNEDRILKALLYSIKKGFYVDIGANYEETDSVTKLFYQEGWSGINVEPVKELYDKLQKKRTRDTNLNIGISTNNKILEFHQSKIAHGHSTFLKMTSDDTKDNFTDYKIETRTLTSVFKEYNVPHIDFIKIDVEGFEYDVVKSNNWARYRPKVVCIEANHVQKDWRPILRENKYKLFIADGLNEYYVAEEHWAITNGFAEKSIKLYHEVPTLGQHRAFNSLKKVAENSIAEINRLRIENENLSKSLARHSLWNKSIKIQSKIILRDVIASLPHRKSN